MKLRVLKVEPLTSKVKGRKYYVVESGDGTPISDKIDTLTEARAELKSIIKEDKEEFGINEDDIGYVIMKYIETDTHLYYEVVSNGH